jgi:hypothetical protein
MTGSTVEVFHAPDLVELFAAEPDLLAVADAIALTQQPAPKRLYRRHWLLLAATAVIAVTIAAPAFGVVQLVVDFFSSPPAPHGTVVSFGQLEVEAPTGMDPQVVAAEARRVAQFRLTDGSAVSLLVAPTKQGGFCEEFSGFEEGCDAAREIPFGLGFAAKALPTGPAIISGSVLSPKVVRVEVTLSNGHTVRPALTRVSEPINASFYFLEIDPALRPVSGRAFDPAGNIVASYDLPTGTPPSPLPATAP